jgi:ecotin
LPEEGYLDYAAFSKANLRCHRPAVVCTLTAVKTLFLALAVVWSAGAALGVDNMRAFPPADPGMTRYVINLPQQKDEADLRVELIIGKMVKTDAFNRYFFGGMLETETIEGWGFDRHILRTLGPMAGTLMAVDSTAPQVERFISLGGEASLLRYNSRLPLVVYVPDEVEVRYRIWRADRKTSKAKSG